MKRNTRSFVYATVAASVLGVTSVAAQATSTEASSHDLPDKVVAARPGYIGASLAREPEPRVLGVAPGGPADAAGLRAGDLIVHVDGGPVETQAFIALVSASAGRTLLLTVMRGGEQKVLHLRPLGAATASDDSVATRALPSLDIAVQRSRFGPYADAASVGNFFVSRSPSGEVYPVSYSWEVPGLVLHEVYGTVGHHWRFEWDAQAEALNVINVNANRKIRTAKVQPDGTLLIGSALFAGEVKVRRGTGGEVFKDGGQGEFKATSVTPEEYRQVVEAELERIRLAKAADAARSEAFWNGVLGGITAAAQAYREVQTQRAASTPMAPRPVPSHRQPQVALTTPVEPPARSQQAAARPLSGAQRMVPHNPPLVGTRRVTESSGESERRTSSNRRATLEAIVVCTKPNAAGAFECDTPVDTNLRGGPKNGLASWNTPESMIAALSASCPGARRLASTTHLVWGCGFGATNNSNSMDRSSGVDVQGRRTYYCSEKQTSCRTIQP